MRGTKGREGSDRAVGWRCATKSCFKIERGREKIARVDCNARQRRRGYIHESL